MIVWYKTPAWFQSPSYSSPWRRKRGVPRTPPSSERWVPIMFIILLMMRLMLMMRTPPFSERWVAIMLLFMMRWMRGDDTLAMMMMIEVGGELVVLFASLIWLWVVASNLSSTTLCPKLLQSTQQTVLWTVILLQGLSIFYRIKTTNCDFSLVKTSKSSTPNYTTQNNYTSLCNCLFHKDFQQSTGKIYKLWLF